MTLREESRALQAALELAETQEKQKNDTIFRYKKKKGNSRPKWNWKIIYFLSQLHLGPSSGDDPRGRGERRPEESALRSRAQGGHARIVRRLGGRGFRAVQGG